MKKQNIDFSFWFAQITYIVDAGYLQSTNSDQLRTRL